MPGFSELLFCGLGVPLLPRGPFLVSYVALALGRPRSVISIHQNLNRKFTITIMYGRIYTFLIVAGVGKVI